MRRKLLLMTAAVICGIVYVNYFQKGWIIVSALAAASLFFFARSSHSAQKRTILILTLCFFAGSILLLHENKQAEEGIFSEAAGRSIRLTAKVTEIQKLEEDSYKLCCSAGGERILISYYHSLENYPELLGRCIQFICKPQVPQGSTNPRAYDYRVYLKSRQIYYIASIDSFKIVSAGETTADRLKRWIFTRREKLLRDLKLSESGQGFVRGVLFGDTKGLSEETYDEFRRNSTAHILAVSGLHIGMLYGVYRALYRRKRSRLFTVAFVLLLMIYGTATLWSVSVTRAVLLILLSVTADLTDRRYDMISALAFAALVSILRNPYVIFGAAFQMSFLAVASMSFFTPVLSKVIGDAWAAAVSVQLGLLPYMAYTFNFVSLTGILCNVPVVFLVSILVPAGIGIFLFYLISGIIVPGSPQILEGLAQMVISVNHFFASGKFLSFDVVSPPLWMIAAFYCGGFFVTSEFFYTYFLRKDWKRLKLPVLSVILSAAMAFSIGSTPFDRAFAVFVDVGQGDCIHLKPGGGRNILIDGGGNIRYNLGEKTLKPYLLKNGVKQIELAAATHLHTDHFLGLSQLAACYPVKKIFTEGEAGQRIHLGKEQWIDILWPLEKAPDTEDENLNSLIFKVHMYGQTILITGDITEEGERMLLQKYSGTDALKCDVLKIAHHGSPYSTCDDFLEAVSPSVAVICCGKNNYGHPSQTVIEKLQKKDIMVYRTDLNGAVGLISRKGQLLVCTKKT